MIPFIRHSKTGKTNNELFGNSERSHVVEHGTKTSKIQDAGFTEENTKQSGMKKGSPGVFKGLGPVTVLLQLGGGKPMSIFMLLFAPSTHI